jgi:RNA polymerase sigma-70 factor (ECF subfamily)
MDISYNQIDATDQPAEEFISNTQEERYVAAIQLFGPALIRLARGYESLPDKRQDLLQEIHVALWRSFASFDGRCSVRTWVYRVAHITATKHVMANRRLRLQEMYSLDDVPEPVANDDDSTADDSNSALQRLHDLIAQLKPVDRQVILLYLEDFSAESIGDVVGLSPRNIATKIHRIKKLLAALLNERGNV